MGRPKGTKNNRRSPEEKESIVLELINGEESSYSISRKYGVSRSLLWTWVETYRNEGIRGFHQKLENIKGNPYAALHTKKNLTEIERLRLELAKKEVECERLKKVTQ